MFFLDILWLQCCCVYIYRRSSAYISASSCFRNVVCGTLVVHETHDFGWFGYYIFIKTKQKHYSNVAIEHPNFKWGYSMKIMEPNWWCSSLANSWLYPQECGQAKNKSCGNGKQSLMVIFGDGFHDIGVSINGGTPSHHPFLDGFSLINHPFSGTPIYGNPHMVLIIFFRTGHMGWLDKLGQLGQLGHSNQA